MANGAFTRTEIDSQPQVWAAALDGFARQAHDLTEGLSAAARQIWLVTGCGSTHYASISAASVMRHHGINAWAFPAAEIVNFPTTLPRGAANLLAISRSGTTTETLWAVDHFRRSNPDGKIVAITTLPDTPLAQAANFVLSADAAQEQSVAQTRSFTSMYLLALCLASALSGDPQAFKRLQALPPALESLIWRAGSLPQQLGEDPSFERFFFLGGGPNYGLACEAMLKTKEMTRSWAEAFHPLEFRHGPMSVVDNHTLVVCLVSDSQMEGEIKVMRHMQRLGARILALVEDASKADFRGLEYVVELHSGLSEWERGPLYLPFVHWMDFYRTLARGLDPDNPVNLTQVVEL